MLKSILRQIKECRLMLGLKQKDMLSRIGISRQQYQQIESNGNPRLETLDLIAQGLNCEIMLIPKDKVMLVQAVLEGKINSLPDESLQNPWADLLGDND